MNGKFDDLKEEVWGHFKDYQHIFLATSEEDQPRVRPVTLVCLDEKFWVLTGTKNAKTKQIRKNPKIEFCLLFQKGEQRGYVRAAGLAKIIQDRKTKVKIAEHCDFFGEHWKGPNDPDYTLIELYLTEIEYLRPKEMLAQGFTL
jgi:general stress protein 26